jgi:hypothetical protein
MQSSLKEYMYKVADYISIEYGDLEQDGHLSDDEKYAVKNIMTAHYDDNDSINNTAANVVSYIRQNRAWMKENIK